MFGRKRRGSSNPPLDRSAVNPNAATAAASAFLSSKPSTASLASAAAGAALRSRPTTPTSVADVQTKRTIRRNSSNSSVGSSVAGVSRPSLERKTSSGSMSERTFRDQSPGRGSIREASIDAPPVPAIPDNLKPAIPPKSHKRSNSLEATPGRITSPPPNRANGRGSSMGPTVGRVAPGRGSSRITSLSSVQELTGVERPASRGNRRLLSMQTAQVTQNGTNLVYDPNTRSFRPATEVYHYDNPIQEVEDRPVRKKKTVQPKGTASGSQIANGTQFGGPKGTAVEAINAAANRRREEQPVQPLVKSQTITPEPAPQPLVRSQVVSPEPAPKPPVAAIQPTSTNSVPAVHSTAVTEPKKKKKKRVTIQNESGSEQGYTSNMSSGNESDVSDVPRKPKVRGTGGLQKRPSIVRELPEDEDSDAQTTATPQSPQKSLGTGTSKSSPVPLPRSNGAARGKGRAKALASEKYAQERKHTRSTSDPSTFAETSTPPTNPNGSALEPGIGRGEGTIRGNRTVSVSPARTTRFAAEPDKPTNLTVMHQPPPRSISPRKSAMKNSNSPRGPSPADDMPGSWSRKAQTSSDLSDNSTALDDRPPRKKKTNRVSFDESNTIVGTAASPVPSDATILPSPQTKDKRSWFGLKNRGAKTNNIGDDEEDEFMKPRPILPSFGSVRERKVREPTEERPLVIPSESHHTSQAEIPSAPPLSTSHNGDVITGVSNDQLVGSVLAQDAASKHTANTSKLLEPLPPEVTSVEGTGYSSDSSVYDNAEERETKVITSGPESIKNGTADVRAEAPRTSSSPDSDHLVFEDTENADSPAQVPSLEVPKIAVIRSTPTLEETEQRKEWIVPGGFPSESSDSDTHSDADTIVPSVPIEPTPASVGIAEPPAESVHLGPTGTPIETPSNNVLVEETDESDHISVYDDAAEDFSDGDGFLSLDAVAASPIQTLFENQTPGLAISTPPESPVDRNIKERAFRKAKQQNGGSEPDMGEGWDKAQQYWASLSADKKRELEREAREDPESSEEDEEEEKEEILPPPKPKTKKRVAVEPHPVVLRSQPLPSHRTYQIPPGSKAVHDGQLTLRSSMRAPPPPNNVQDTTTHMRKSMRNGRSKQGSMRESSEALPAMQPKGSLQKKNRPMSHPPPVSQPDPIAVQNQIRRMSATPVMTTPVNGKKKVAVAPQLKRSNSTDSDSSFRRTRPIAHSMRGSMRNPVGQEKSQRTTSSYSTDGENPRSSIFRMRSLSPTGSASRRPFNSSPPVSLGHGTMRGTMRSSSIDSPKSSLISGFGRSSSKTPSKNKTTAPRSRSRFVDSSDEEDARPAFRSRFVDSSDDDDDEPIPLPARTMRNSTLRSTPASTSAPKKKLAPINDVESSDLPDSDDEKPKTTPANKQAQQLPAQNSAAPTSLRRSGSGREYNLSSPTLRDSQKQQRSFLNILRRKKDPGSKVRKSDVESAARRDTPLERSRSELLGVRQISGSSVLQKRNGGPLRTSSSGVDTWPLSPVQRDGERPATADDAALRDEGGGRPSMKGRRNTATGLLDVDVAGRVTGTGTTTTVTTKNSNVVLGRSGKPKRFMGLRKVLGIKD